MIRSSWWVALIVAAAVGCNGNNSAPPQSQAAAHDHDHDHDHAPPGITANSATGSQNEAGKEELRLTEEELSWIAKLPEGEDRLAATQQIVCPISNEKLGSMGIPIKKVVDGQTVFLCCPACNKSLEDDPKGALAKLAK